MTTSTQPHAHVWSTGTDAALWERRPLPAWTSAPVDGLIRARLTDSSDDGALAALVRNHFHSVWGLAAVLTLDMTPAAEATVKTFASAAVNRTGLALSEHGPRVWLLREVRRRVESLSSGDEIVDLRTERAGVFGREPDDDLVTSVFSLLERPERAAVWVATVERLGPEPTGVILDRATVSARATRRGALRDLRHGMGLGHQSDSSGRCLSTAQRFSRYLADELTATDRRTFDLHIAGCSDCLARVDALEDPGPALADRLVEPPTDLYRVVRGAVGMEVSGPDGEPNSPGSRAS